MTVYFRGNADTIYSNTIYKATINLDAKTATFDLYE